MGCKGWGHRSIIICIRILAFFLFLLMCSIAYMLCIIERKKYIYIFCWAVVLNAAMTTVADM